MNITIFKYQLLNIYIIIGIFYPFPNNTISFDLEILECDTNIYLYQDIENIGFKSW